MLKYTIVAVVAAAMMGSAGISMAAANKVGDNDKATPAQRAAAATRNAAHTTAQATRNAAHKTAKATRHAAHKTANATRHAAHETAKATRKAAHKVKHATHKAVHPTSRRMNEAPEYRASTTREQRMQDAHSNWQRTRRL